MWNPTKHQEEEEEEEDDSWEVRAFAEDTRNNNMIGTTWPPRSYTCTFCRREFRSAQALGGHMNVHRRDRARLHHHPLPPPSPNNIPSQELVANGGLCLFYHLPSPNNVPLFSTHAHSTTSTLNACVESSPSTLRSVSSYPPNNLMVMPTYSPSLDFEINGFSSSKVEEPKTSSTNRDHHEELDLELRLGHGSTPT